jgi:voltage-gated potassium channel Kch
MKMEKPKESIFGYFTEFWSEERKMTGFLAALIVDTLMLYPLVSAVSSSVGIQTINVLVTLAVFILGLFALTHHKIIRMVFGGLFTIVISVHLARFVFGADWLLGWDMLLPLLIIIAYLGFVLRYVYKKGPVTRQRIEGAVAAYLLITIAFALSYILISFLIPGAFRFPDEAPNIDDLRFGYIFHYFSISTITTLGYGDIVPVHPFSRTLATIEALVGQLYPAILLARLVSLSVVDSQRSDKQRTMKG